VVEVIDGCDLLLFGLVGFTLELLHEFNLISKSLPPELLPLIVLNLPVREFLFKFLNVLIMVIVNPQIILFFLFQ
jgi:hypothetical protein